MAGSLVYVTTENDTVDALDATNGSLVWSTHLGTPVPSSALPCGDISPTVGITSTPVIDEARGEIFVVADEMINGVPAHQLVGLGLSTGAVMLNQNVDPPGAYTPALLQRVALTLDAGKVIFGFGGNFGDCSSYHGWVVEVPEAGGPMSTLELDPAPGASQGAVWMGGAAPIVDGQGNIWVARGNGSVASSGGPFDLSDSVLELSASLQLEQIFTASTRSTDNTSDLDLGSSSPVLLANGEVLQAGKSKTAYLLSQAHSRGHRRTTGHADQLLWRRRRRGQRRRWLGRLHALPERGHGRSDERRTPGPRRAVEDTDRCRRAAHRGRRADLDDQPEWDLFGLNPANGQAVEEFALGAEANHFPTPAAGDGLLLAASSNAVHAFFTKPPPVVGMATTTDGGGYWLAAADGGSV